MAAKLGYLASILLVISIISCEPIEQEETDSSSSSSSSSAPVVTELNIFQSAATHPGYIGTRIQSNAACESEYTINSATWGISCSNFVSLLGYTAENGVQDLVSDFSIPSSVPVNTIDGVEVSSNITNLINNGPDVNLTGLETGMSDVEAFTGFANGGAVASNCSEWASGGNTESYKSIEVTQPAPSWNNWSGDCATEIRPFFCLCW